MKRVVYELVRKLRFASKSSSGWGLWGVDEGRKDMIIPSVDLWSQKQVVDP